MNNITQAQKNKLDYMDLLIKEEKTDKQRLDIEKNQRQRLINKRKEIKSDTKRVTMCYGKFYDIEKDSKEIERLSEEYVDSLYQ